MKVTSVRPRAKFTIELNEDDAITLRSLLWKVDNPLDMPEGQKHHRVRFCHDLASAIDEEMRQHGMEVPFARDVFCIVPRSQANPERLVPVTEEEVEGE